MNEVLIGAVSAMITGLSGFYWGWRKNNVELENSTLKNIQTQIAIYETIIENLREEISILISKVEEQRQIITELEKKIESMYSKDSSSSL